MINHIDASISQLAIHDVNDLDGVSLKPQLVDIKSPDIESFLLSYFLDNFAEPKFYCFSEYSMKSDSDNAYKKVNALLTHQEKFMLSSIALAKDLYQASQHPNIKSGHFVLAHIKDVLIEDELVDALCIFKIENKTTFLQLEAQSDNYEMHIAEGIAINKVDKACIIFNTEAELGYKVCAVDKSNPGAESQFWLQDFLGLTARKDDYYHTKNYIQATKQFIDDRVKPIYEIDKTEEAELLNRSLNFLNQGEAFESQEYERRIFKDENLIEEFQDYKKDFQTEQQVNLEDKFTVSQAAVKSQSKVFKSILKLDKNFHVYIHGNRNMIEKGTDDMGRKFYKLFYEEENWA